MNEKRKVDKSRGERIRFVRTEVLGLRSQEKLAELIASETGETITRGAVGNWELGKEVGFTNLRALARLGKVPLDWLADNVGEPDFAGVSTPESEGEVPVVGYVGAGAAAHYYAVSQGELDRVPAPANATKDTVAVEIKGDSVGPLFNQWLVFYDAVRSPVTSDQLGRLCVVGLADDRILVKQIRQSRKFPGLHDLISNTPDEPVIEGAHVTWAARVTNLVPRS